MDEPNSVGKPTIGVETDEASTDLLSAYGDTWPDDTRPRPRA